MDLLLICFSIFGGLGLFLYSMNQLSNSLKRTASASLYKMLKKLTNNPFKGMLIGTFTTFIVQSSSITVLILLGLVNSGILSFRNAVYVILGSEIGTTITAQIVAFKIGKMFLPIIALGFFIQYFSKKESMKMLGIVIFNFGLLFLSMDIMISSAKDLKDIPLITNNMGIFGKNPLLGIIAGALLTAIVHSSSAITSLIIAFGMEGVINLKSGIAIVLGANLGTCVLELLASINTSIDTKRTAIAQFIINLIDLLVFLPFLGSFTALVQMTSSNLPRQLANAHTIFNVIGSLLIIPILGPIINFIEKLIPKKETKEAPDIMFFEKKLLNFPYLALKHAQKKIIELGKISEEMLFLSQESFFSPSKEKIDSVIKKEETIDELSLKCVNYLMNIRSNNLTEKDIERKDALLNTVIDIERVGDLSVNIVEFANEIKQKKIVFSKKHNQRIKEVFDLVYKTYNKSIKILQKPSKISCKKVFSMENEIDDLEDSIRELFLKETKKQCPPPRTIHIYLDTLRNLERVGDHSDNIAEYFYNQCLKK